MISRSERPQFDVDLDSQLPRVLRWLRVRRWPHRSKRPWIDGLTGLFDLTFDDFAGLSDLNSMDDLDLMRFLSQFSIFT